MRSRWAILASVLLAAMNVSTGGCRSRWARDDVDYAAKYGQHSNDPARIAKQSLDARHLVGKRGVYAGFAGQDEPGGAGAEAGVFIYPRSWLETRVGGALLAHEGEHPLSGGAIVGARVQPPSRLAPFAGVTGYVGWAGMRSADNDWIDNDSDGLIDEFGENEQNFVGAVAPELGIHYWVTSRIRLTGGVDYRLTTDGRGNDSLFYGMSLAILERGQQSPPRPIGAHDERGWQFSEGSSTWDPPLPPSDVVVPEPWSPEEAAE